jgi:hypothetical protein
MTDTVVASLLNDSTLISFFDDKLSNLKRYNANVEYFYV